MKMLFYTGIFLVFSQISSASAVSFPAVKVNSLAYNLSIEDGGWRTSGSLSDNGIWNFDAEKVFKISYDGSPGDSSDDQNTSLQLSIIGTEKCNDLGAMEYPGQVNGLPTGSISSIQSVIAKSVVLPSSSGARFICLVHIQAQVPKAKR